MAIKGLSHPINLGKLFLTNHRAQHDHEKEELSLRIPSSDDQIPITLQGDEIRIPKKLPHMFIPEQELEFQLEVPSSYQFELQLIKA